MPDPVPICSPRELSQRFGIEVTGPNGHKILFPAGQWAPGRDYTQQVILRNVSLEVKKLKYKLPTTTLFSMPFPEIIVLSPGMSFEVEVTFRPIVYECYADAIFFHVNNGNSRGGFYVEVQALIPTLDIEIPSEIDFGFCATAETSTRTFRLKNTGEIPAPYSWTVPLPFHLTPLCGTVDVGSSCEIVVSVFPTDARVFVSSAKCKVGEGSKATIKKGVQSLGLSAIGKYSFISLSENVVDFGKVLVGTNCSLTSKNVVLRNPSMVKTDFACVRRDSDRLSPFVISPMSGTLQAESEVTITITYYSQVCGTFSLDQYQFSTPGGSKTSIDILADSVPPVVTASKTSSRSLTSIADETTVNDLDTVLDFGDIEIGETIRKSLFVRNHSILEQRYQVLIGGIGGENISDSVASNHVFQVACSKGIVRPNSEVAMMVNFKPPFAINYYNRIFVLVENHPPIVIDMYGSGYVVANGDIKEQRPLPITFEHVIAFRNRQVLGSSKMSSSELDTMYKALWNATSLDGDGDDDGNNIDFDMSLWSLQEKISMFAISHDVWERASVPAIANETQGTRPPPLLSSYLKFDRTNNVSSASVRSPLTRSGEDCRENVAVYRELFLSQTDKSANEVYLSCDNLDFGYCKQTIDVQDFRSKTIVVTNTTHGRMSISWTYPGQKADEFDATISPERSKHGNLSNACVVIEPNCCDVDAGKSASFRVIVLSSAANMHFQNEIQAICYYKNQRTFRLVSDAVLTPPIALSIQVYNHTFNHSHLSSIVKAATLPYPTTEDMDPTSTITFPACYFGDSVYQTYRLNNYSNLPTRFSLSLAPTSCFTVYPQCGIIPHDSFQLICVRFSPPMFVNTMDIDNPVKQATRRSYSDSISCFVNKDESSSIGDDKVSTTIVVQGFGELPAFMFDDEDVEAGVSYVKPTCSGMTSTKDIIVRNVSRIPLHFLIHTVGQQFSDIQFFPLSGLLRGNESVVIKATFSPSEEGYVHSRLVIEGFALTGEGGYTRDSRQLTQPSMPPVLCRISRNIVGLATSPQVRFIPEEVLFDVSLTKTLQSRSIEVENMSESDVPYRLFVQEKVAVDGDSECCLVKEYKLSQKRREEQEESLCCSNPSGVLRARSKTTMQLFFQPKNAGMYQYGIMCSANVDSNQIMPSKIDFSRHQCKAEGEATSPKVVFRDSRYFGESTLCLNRPASIWLQFSLDSMNELMTCPNFDNNLAREPIKWMFSPSPINSSSQIIRLEMYNPGQLQVRFRFRFPNEKTVEVDMWADDALQTEEDIQNAVLLEEIKCFSVSPSSGILDPGQSSYISVSYAYTSMIFDGHHKVPMLLEIENGRSVPIELHGTTLDTNATLLQISSSLKVRLVSGEPEVTLLQLSNVEVGTHPEEASMQQFEICNPSNCEVEYEIDSSILDCLKQGNLANIGSAVESDVVKRIISEESSHWYNCTLMSFANIRGLIGPRSSGRVKLYFYPLSARTYTIPVKIEYKRASFPSSSSLVLFLRVKGCDSLSSSQEALCVPKSKQSYQVEKQTSVWQDQNAFLSHDLIQLGRLSVGSIENRIFGIRNCLRDASLEFEIKSEEIMNKKIIMFEPISGKIPPKSVFFVRVTFDACCRARIIDETFVVLFQSLGQNGPESAMIEESFSTMSDASKFSSTRLSESMTLSRHPSIVSRPTISRSRKLLGALNEKAHLPTTTEQLMNEKVSPIVPIIRSTAFLRIIAEVSSQYQTNIGKDSAASRTIKKFTPFDFDVSSKVQNRSAHDKSLNSRSYNGRQKEVRKMTEKIIMQMMNGICSGGSNAVFAKGCPQAKDESYFSTIVPGSCSTDGRDDEIRDWMRMSLPSEQRTPYFVEFNKEQPLLVKLQKLFYESDTDGSGDLDFEELKVMLRNLGFQHRSDLARHLIDSAGTEMTGKVSLRDFVGRMPLELRHQLETAIDKSYTSKKKKDKTSRKLVAEREKMKVLEVTSGQRQADDDSVSHSSDSVSFRKEQAAVSIQKISRGRNARKRVGLQKLSTAVGLAKVAIGRDVDLKCVIGDFWEKTICNLVREASDGIFMMDGQTTAFMTQA